MNVLKLRQIVAGPIGRTCADVRVFTGDASFPILATAGGIVEYLVRLNDPMEPGHPFAIRRNGFGEVIAESVSGASGEVLGLRSDATAEPGNPHAFILFNAPAAEQTQVYPE